MERRAIKGLNRPLVRLELKAFGICLFFFAITIPMTHWIGKWAFILPFLGLLVSFVVEGRRGTRYFMWALMTTHCPQCGTWPMKFKGSDGKNRGFLVCEKCQIEWDLGKGRSGGDFDPAPISGGISEIIDKHIQSNDPPETKQTLDRLTRQGHTVDEARQLVSMAVMVEIFHGYVERKPFDARRYAWNLAQLPHRPWDANGREIFKAAKFN